MEYRIEVFILSNCPFCKRATTLLENNDLRFNAFRLDKMDTIMASNIFTDAKTSTVPIIYIDGDLVGGTKELRAWLKENNYEG